MKPRRIEVRYRGKTVGELATNGRQTFFQYDPQWVSNGEDLSPLVMKKRSEVIEGNDPGFHFLPPLFSDSLPDAYGRRIMGAWFRKHHGDTYAPTPLDMLGYVGETGMGALTYHPVASSFPVKIYREMDIRAQHKLSRAIESKGLPEGELVEEARRAVHTVGGAYPKFLCAENPRTGEFFEDDPRLRRGFTRWIVKLAQDTRPYHGEIEFFLNRLAQAAGITVPKTKLTISRDEKKRIWKHFAVERFDRDGDERLHVSSLAALIGRPANRLDIDYNDLFRVTHEVTRNAAIVEEAYRRMIFNVAVSNTDDHAKNHAFIYRGGNWTLSPSFDLTFAPGTPGAEAVRAMPIQGHSTALTLPVLLEAGKRAGIGRYRAIARDVFTAVIEARKTLKGLDFDPKPLTSVLDTIVKKATELGAPLKSSTKGKGLPGRAKR